MMHTGSKLVKRQVRRNYLWHSAHPHHCDNQWSESNITMNTGNKLVKRQMSLTQGSANFLGSRAGWAPKELAAGRTGKFYVKDLITVD